MKYAKARYLAAACCALWIHVPRATCAKQVDFAHDVVPVLRQYCGECHTGDKRQGGFSLNTRETLLAGGDSGAAVVPGDAAASALVRRITSDDESLQMPPEGDRVPADQVALLVRWIAEGVPWEAGFAFKKAGYQPPLRPRRPELPPVVDGREHPLDRLIDDYYAQHEIPRPQPADDAVFLRRVYLDVIGLLPRPEEAKAFLEDQAPKKRERLVHELLGRDTDYAEHWLTFWNDLLRNDYSGTGFITGGRKQITRWLYQSLLENKPYDQLVRELIAPTPASEGFIEGIRWRGNVNSSQTQEIQFAQNTSQAFLGINMKCASCHNSFIDRWTLAETYGLAAVYATGKLEIHRCDKPTGRHAQAAWIFPSLGEIDAAAPQPQRLKQLAGLMTHSENGRFTRTIVNRLWHRLMGRGIVHPVDAMHTQPWHEDLLDYLATHHADHGYDLKETIALICTCEAYQAVMPARRQPGGEGQYVFRGPVPRRMTAEQFLDAVWQITAAAPNQPHADVQRAAEGQEKKPPMVRASLMKNNAFLRALGRPTRDQIVTMRPNELTTLEAIDLANEPMLADAIGRGAERLLAEYPDSPQALIQWVFASALTRPPTGGELSLARDLLSDQPQRHNVEDLLWSVMMLPEFQLIR